MAKQGEGSRGGHVIGHTKGGNPIYGSAADHAAKVDAGKKHDSTARAQAREDAHDTGESASGRKEGVKVFKQAQADYTKKFHVEPSYPVSIHDLQSAIKSGKKLK